MSDWIEDNLGTFVILVCGGLVTLAIFAGYKEQQGWDQYATVHHCVPAGTKAASNSIGIDSKGHSVITYNPEQKIYRCDGGEIQIR